MAALESCVVTPHLLGHEVIRLQDGLLSGRIELIPGPEGSGLLHEFGNHRSVLIDHGSVEQLNRFLVRIDGDLTNSVANVCACVHVRRVTHPKADEVFAAGPYLPIRGKDRDRIGAPVLEVGIVTTEPVGRRYVRDVDLDIVVRCDEQGHCPLLRFVQDLYGLAEGTMLEDLLAEASCREEQKDKDSEEIKWPARGHDRSLSHKYIRTWGADRWQRRWLQKSTQPRPSTPTDGGIRRGA